MRTISFQFAVFTRDVINRPDNLFYIINSGLDNLCDGMPSIIPIPNDAPFEIPVVQGGSSDGKYRLNVSRNRVDLFINTNLGEDAAKLIKNSFAVVSNFFQQVNKEYDCNRVGIISTLFEECDTNIDTMSKNIMPDLYSENCVELAARRNIISTVDGIRINNLQSVETCTLTKGNEPQNGVLIIIDVNSVATVDSIINIDLFKKIFNKAQQEIEWSVVKELVYGKSK